jgi:hypothetical protein
MYSGDTLLISLELNKVSPELKPQVVFEIGYRVNVGHIIDSFQKA